MIGNAKIGAALVGGYLLGRTKKAKAAIGLGMFLAGRKLDLDPRQLAGTLAASPALSGLGDQARRELLDATKSAATTALTDRANHLADSLHERTRRLDGPEDAHDAEDADDADDADEDDRGETDESAERGKPAKRPAPRRRAAATKPATKPAKSASKTARKSAPKKAKARSGGRGGDDG